MTTTAGPDYLGREQTKAKHRVLERYLTAFAHIIGRGGWRDILYVDCCAGPWKTTRPDHSDSSFSIAVQQLRNARTKLAQEHKNVNFRCLFIEQKPDAYSQLSKFCDSVSDMEVKAWNGDFVELIPRILRYAAERSGSFPFFFIDPLGWTPLTELEPLRPLLESRPGEVLITFMTSQIRRWIDAKGKNFGMMRRPGRAATIGDLCGVERDDEFVLNYAGEVAKAGNFDWVCTTAVLNPKRDDTHYHLIYGTRHDKGVEEFKNAERNASELMALSRAEVEERHQVEELRQSVMFTVHDYGPGQDRYLMDLRNRYTRLAHDQVAAALQRMDGMPLLYDDAWKIACRYPFVWKAKLDGWIRTDWADKIIVGNKKPAEAFRCRSGITLWWKAPGS